MMKVTIATSRKELNEMAKGFEIKFVGVSTENLVEAINNKIDALLNGSEEVVATPTAEPQAIITETGAQYQIPADTEILTLEEDKKEETSEAVKKEVKTLADFELAEGQLVQIIGEGLPGRSKNLDGRQAEVVGISRRGFVRVVLLNKEGQKQNCICPMPAANIIKVEEVKSEDKEGAVA